MAWAYTPPAYGGGSTLVGNWGTVAVSIQDFEAIANDIQHWGGNVDAGQFQLTNLAAFQFHSGALPGSPTIGEIAVDSVTSTPKIWALGSNWTQLAPITLQRTIPGTVNNEIDIGSFTFSDAISLWISVTAEAASYGVAKMYAIAAQYNATNNNWAVVIPISTSGVYSGPVNFEMDVNVNNSVLSLRLRDTAGTLTPTASIMIRQDGNQAYVFTSSSNTSAVAAPTSYFGGGTGGTYATAYSSVAQSIPNNTLTALTFDTNVEDSNNSGTLVHSTSSNTSRFTVPTGQAGRYHVGFGVGFGSGVNMSGQIRVNGATIVATAVGSGQATVNGAITPSTYLFLNAADYVEFVVLQAAGSAQNTIAGRGQVWGQILRIS
jgi:hypothetical protein